MGFSMYFLLIILVLNFIQSDVDSSFRVMTFNIRFDNPADSINSWDKRKKLVVEIIKESKADFIGTQEGLYHQLEYIDSSLSRYSWFGAGRDDGRKKGEFTAIFYNTVRFDLIDQNTFWLSETPDKPGLGWDAACNRTLTWGVFFDRLLKKEIYVFNTHFDHVGEIFRRESAYILLKKIPELTSGKPFVLCGDFNASPESEVYSILTGNDLLVDSRRISATSVRGPQATFNGFNFGQVEGNPIDYIFVPAQFQVIDHKTIDKSLNKRYPSDHFPVLATIKYEN